MEKSNPIDFTVVCFIINKNRVLLVLHKELNKWLPVGGHIEPGEDPEEALFREIQEECGLKVEILSKKPGIKFEGRKYLLPPVYLDIHSINENHRHVAMVYFGKTEDENFRHEDSDHYDTRWFSESDLENREYNIQEDIKFYSKEAIKMARE